MFCRENNFELIIVNDGSKDDTELTLDRYKGESCFQRIRNKVNKGYGGAIKEGIKAANTTYIATMDADGQHNIEDVKKLFQYLIDTDADMTIGQRMERSGVYRETGKILIKRIASFLMPVTIKDLNSGLKLYRSDLARKYSKLCPDSMAFSDVIALTFLSQRHLVLEMPVRIKPRRDGTSTISTFTAFETVKQILNIVILFNPMRIFLPLSIFSITISLLWAIPIIVRGNGVSVGAMLGIVTGIFFFFAGLLAEQLSLLRKASLEND